MLGLFNFKVFWRQLDWGSLPATAQSVANGALQVKVERIAVFVLLGLISALVTLTETVLLMLALLILGKI